MQLKENIFIEGFNTFRGCVLAQDSHYDKLIYSGLTSKIPKEVAKECVKHDYLAGYYINDWPELQFPKCFNTAKELIINVINSKYCLIYKT